jgi:hypothetical protein
MKKVLSKSGKREVRTLTLDEREHLRSRIAEERAYLDSFKRPESGENADAHISPGQLREVDTGAIEARIRRKEEQLKRQSPENFKLQGAKRQEACLEMKKHEEWLKKHMLTTYEMGAYPSATDPIKDAKYRAACEKSHKMEVGNKEFGERAQRYKELARRLDPDNPELHDIERLRSKRRY